jgi:hypothetical protein
VRAAIDRRRSDKDCDYKAMHDFLRRFGKFRQHHSGTALADKNGQALAYVYFKDETGRRTTGKLPTRDEARRIAANIAEANGAAAKTAGRKNGGKGAERAQLLTNHQLNL